MTLAVRGAAGSLTGRSPSRIARLRGALTPLMLTACEFGRTPLWPPSKATDSATGAAESAALVCIASEAPPCLGRGLSCSSLCCLMRKGGFGGRGRTLYRRPPAGEFRTTGWKWSGGRLAAGAHSTSACRTVLFRPSAPTNSRGENRSSRPVVTSRACTTIGSAVAPPPPPDTS
ncbi:hypothetical protein Vretimale_6135 [Volvox reticuliferus]|uniref:Uncharacterized protein n=1 Tax=Volvox reticuliferus TaxID=1737510 RepID=A0A8J4CFS3_9CHLO|nr:hypothetical protein Vretifemale_7960 [Volvox reticuliferus]GIM01328.1 hypothetical protein Vretimale_6135 [Volvox reticuliferus]